MRFVTTFNRFVLQIKMKAKLEVGSWMLDVVQARGPDVRGGPPLD